MNLTKKLPCGVTIRVRDHGWENVFVDLDGVHGSVWTTSDGDKASMTIARANLPILADLINQLSTVVSDPQIQPTFFERIRDFFGF